MVSIILLSTLVCVFASVCIGYRPAPPLPTYLQRNKLQSLGKQITPNEGESMEEYRKKLRSALKKPIKETGKFGGRQLLAAIVTKWGVSYDIQIRTSAALGEGSENVYAHIMWSYYGQKSFGMSSKVYMEHLEAVAQYISAVGKVDLFRDKVAMCRKRPNAYFGYAVTIPLDVPPSTVAPFFKMLE